MSTKLPIRCVILDWSGSVLDKWGISVYNAITEAFEMKGIPVMREEIGGSMGSYKGDHFGAILKTPTVQKRWFEKYGRKSDNNDLVDLMEYYIPKQMNMLDKYGKLFQGTMETCKLLKDKGLELGSTTGFTIAMVNKILSINPEIKEILDINIAADQVPMGRPAPFMIYEIMKELKIINPSQIVKVGDTKMDIYEGLNAGTWTIGLCESSSMMDVSEDSYKKMSYDEYCNRIEKVRRELHDAGAHFVVNNIESIPYIIELIKGIHIQGKIPATYRLEIGKIIEIQEMSNLSKRLKIIR